MERVLITGASGPAGLAMIRSLLKRAYVETSAEKTDRWASRHYLVPPERRRIVPRVTDCEFASAVISLCAANSLTVLFEVDPRFPGGNQREIDDKRRSGYLFITTAVLVLAVVAVLVTIREVFFR